MAILLFNQCAVTYFLVIFHVSQASTHWMVTEDGKIHTQDDSLFQMRRPYDLMAFLQQEKRAEVFGKIKSQLIVQKEGIETESLSDNDDDVEQLVYLTNADCIKAGKPLIEFDLYVGTLVFAYPKPSSSDYSDAFPDEFPLHLLRTASPITDSTQIFLYDANTNLYTLSCSNTSNPLLATLSRDENEIGDEEEEEESIADRVKYGPDCSEYLPLDFSMTSFEHLQSIRDRKHLNIDPEKNIHRIVGKWRNYRQFGRDISDGLKQNSSSWILYTLASFYWRGAGKAEQAIECARRALHTAPFEFRPIPQLSLATILHRARAFEEAALVLHATIDITSDLPYAHYSLGNIYATLADYNKSIICYENVLKLVPDFPEVTLRRAAVVCHAAIENALKSQHDNLQKTLEELKDYQKQQELWINYHKKLRAEQAPPTVLLEQRLQYRDLKRRQREEAIENGEETETNALGNKPNRPKGGGGTLLGDIEIGDEVVLAAGTKVHFKFMDPDGSEEKNFVFQIDGDSAEVLDSVMTCEEKKKKKKGKGGGRKGATESKVCNGGNGNESNDSEDATGKGASGGTATTTGNNNAKRHLPLEANSPF